MGACPFFGVDTCTYSFVIILRRISEDEVTVLVPSSYVDIYFKIAV